MKSMFPAYGELVGKVMNLQLQRQNVVSSNVSNAKTPEYKPMELEFEDKLQKALGLDMNGKLTSTSKYHLPATFDPNKFSGDWDKEFKPRNISGEDRVNLEKEMVKMAKVTLQYTALTSVIRSNFEGLKTAIQEGQK